MPGSSDPHFNLFHAYRGGATTQVGRRRQLEDNLTRALGIVLQRLRGSPLAAGVLRELGVPTQFHEKPYEVQFQVVAAGASWPPPERRHLIAVVAGGSPDSELEIGVADEGVGARPDLVLLWKEYALVVESEITAAADRPQMDRMHEAFGTAGSGTSYPQTTWHRLAGAVRTISGNAPEPNRYVLEQFEEYMRVNGFGGFADEHFAYFALSADRRRVDSTTRIGARRALEHLLTELQTMWQVTWHPHVGNLNADDPGMWGNLAPSGAPAPHLSVGVGADGLHVFANVETQRPFECFRNAWAHDSDSLLAFVARLADDEESMLERNPWMFAVKRRQQKRDEKGAVIPRKFWYFPAAQISASAASGLLQLLIDEAIDFPSRGEAAPEITIGRHYETWQVLSQDFLEQCLVADARRTEEFFAWLGSPVARSENGRFRITDAMASFGKSRSCVKNHAPMLTR